MEAPEEVAMGSNEQTNIVKGKRTKRLRPQSPTPFPHYSGGDDTKSSSSEYVSTEEEEDMANCLILLAQGQSRDQSPKQDDVDTGAICHKFNSRRFMEAPSTGGGKAGYYVYECKTCNRTFPSFQALGGHRASHKKPRASIMAVEEKRHFSDEEGGQFSQFIKNNNTISSNLSLQLSNHNNNRGGLFSNNNKRGKVHECSICGAEFNSGQALGGHMRRHRGPTGSSSTTLSLTPMAGSMETEQPKKQRSVLSLDLDLNLPAPEEDHRESKFPFASKQQQQPKQQQPPPQQQQPQSQPPLVFSTPALVGCQY
ncbi:hypothetical protein SLEP1_g5490 [Rubroshorea leprosula]|uniref:C2H2-type domain-containing protein n=1 Tax=Rubroshorea leprosula TaxID=152421 RepID=A0AAV5I0Z2_9ROSI|nr:hypothetical protein SLEP1_g5490 [Rubroshorea leprosula]